MIRYFLRLLNTSKRILWPLICNYTMTRVVVKKRIFNRYWKEKDARKSSHLPNLTRSKVINMCSLAKFKAIKLINSREWLRKLLISLLLQIMLLDQVSHPQIWWKTKTFCFWFHQWISELNRHSQLEGVREFTIFSARR